MMTIEEKIAKIVKIMNAISENKITDSNIENSLQLSIINDGTASVFAVYTPDRFSPTQKIKLLHFVNCQWLGLTELIPRINPLVDNILLYWQQRANNIISKLEDK